MTLKSEIQLTLKHSTEAKTNIEENIKEVNRLIESALREIAANFDSVDVKIRTNVTQ
jgi:hypothetical protein